MDTTLSDEQQLDKLEKLFKRKLFWKSIKAAATAGAVIGTFVAAVVVTKGAGDFINQTLFGNKE